MADLRYLQKNRIRQEMASEKFAMRKMILGSGGALALALTVAFPAGLFLWLGLLVLALFFTFGRDPIRESGAFGEDFTLSVLKTLPDHYVVFNQVELPDPCSRTGYRELDFVVLGPSGIFVIESKNHNGRIEGEESDAKWTIHKTGRRGGRYRGTIRNPVRQTKHQVQVMRQYLKKRKVTEGITGVVALSGNGDLSGINSPSVPVLRALDLPRFILEYGGKVKNMKGAISALSQLRKTP